MQQHSCVSINYSSSVYMSGHVFILTDAILSLRLHFYTYNFVKIYFVPQKVGRGKVVESKSYFFFFTVESVIALQFNSTSLSGSHCYLTHLTQALTLSHPDGSPDYPPTYCLQTDALHFLSLCPLSRTRFSPFIYLISPARPHSISPGPSSPLSTFSVFPLNHNNIAIQ